MHLLAGPPSKKRKLNEISHDEDDEMAKADDELAAQNLELRQRLAAAEAKMALMMQGGAKAKDQA